MTDPEQIDDPIWEYLLATKIQPYLEAIRKWWSEYKDLRCYTTGVLPVKYEGIECPPGLMMRMTSTPVRSPIKGVQAFPYIPTAYFSITGVPGGVNKMVEYVCKKGLTIEEFTVVEKHNLPSTYQKGQFVALIPTEVLEDTKDLGKYVYLTTAELINLAQGICPKTVPGKCAQYLL